MIAFTKDNWATSNMAIGKIFDENIIGTNGTKGATAYGIAAPYLVGTVLAGRNLIIDTENGSFRVDSSGVTLDSMKLNIVSSAGNGTGLTFDADEGLTHVVKKTEGGRTHTYEAGFSATNDNDKGYGLYFAVDGSNKLYFDVSDAELVVDGDIWCRSLYLGKSRTDILTYIDSDGVEHSTTDRGKMNAIGGQYISCAGLSIEGSDGSFSIDNNGNVVIENGSIHMQSGNNTIDIDASTGLLFKRGGLMKLKLDITTGDVTLGDGAILTAPKITGGEITGGIFRATGQGRNNEAAYYIQNGNVRCGYISYDSNGAGTAQEAKERVFFTTVDNVALKIQSSGNMSLAAGNNNQKTVYIASDTEINGTLKIGGETAATREYLKDELDKLRSWVSNNFMAV